VGITAGSREVPGRNPVTRDNNNNNNNNNNLNIGTTLLILATGFEPLVLQVI
jgi:hypothetical protein